ncbi:hypothetical protein E2A64_13480 [Pseudohoeflea suaedae]|uniref:Uncharacterized protein n=1 Tax=Pseudohoeflea suaedae TaxID=877384 RepID=A0A4R5PKW6_9HYPH|nr:hypothetical protein E2A64_13480 [Pseudohoeflea suaedae]
MFAAAPVQAENLRGQDLKTLVSGKRIYLQTPFGGEFPLYYQTSGAVSGDGSALGLGKFMAPKETGKWWVDGANLCQQWPTWYDGKATCFTIEKTGAKTLNWVRDDGKSGTARIDS